ncbi:MAG: hypothetical protein IJP23_04310 [Oscillospiraceae bacterium]|nr:hypothetical protein [Oscillospiraceae bacterium]
MKNTSGLNNKITDEERRKMQAAIRSDEAQKLKNALQNSGGSVDELKEAFSAGDMEKTKSIMEKLFADESCANALRQLEEKFSGK